MVIEKRGRESPRMHLLPGWKGPVRGLLRRCGHCEGQLQQLPSQIGGDALQPSGKTAIRRNGPAATPASRTHTGERPHRCDWEGCGKTFALESAPRIHKQSHSTEKPYRCDWEGRGKEFALAQHLAQHKRTHCTETIPIRAYERCYFVATSRKPGSL